MASKYLSLAFLASLPLALAQTYTSCNPMTQTGCAPNPGIKSSVFSTDFTQSSTLPAGWGLQNQGSVKYDANGANFILAKQGDSPTFVSNGYMLFGSMEVVMKAASGQGIVSSLILLSDDLDELDWEFIGGNDAQVQSNYFGKGDTTTYNRAAWHNVADPQGGFHSYKFTWTPQSVIFSIDGATVRTLNYADAGTNGNRFPQTPMRVRIGIWAGGDPSLPAGTVQWAGGPTNYGAGPFTMTVKSVNVVNYSPADSYTWKDQTGSYQSIQVNGGTLNSAAGASGSSNSSSPSSQQTAAATTSLSIASAAPTVNPVTNAPTSSIIINTSSLTGAATVLPTTTLTAAVSPAGTATGKGQANPTGNAAAPIAGPGSAVALAVALAMLV